VVRASFLLLMRESCRVPLAGLLQIRRILLRFVTFVKRLACHSEG
jgi:hypothetical protein